MIKNVAAVLVYISESIALRHSVPFDLINDAWMTFTFMRGHDLTVDFCFQLFYAIEEQQNRLRHSNGIMRTA